MSSKKLAKGSKSKQQLSPWEKANQAKEKLKQTRNIYKRFNTTSKKRRSEGLLFIEEIDCDKLDKMVNMLFSKFIYHYEYEDTFILPDIPEVRISEFIASAKEEKFQEKLETYFRIYGIEAKERVQLVSYSDEGSYILKHAKIWIMFIQTIIDKGNPDFSAICEIFNNAINFDVDEHLLFDYFFTLSKWFDIEQMESNESSKIPKRFLEIYNENKEHIMKLLEEEEEELQKEQGFIEGVEENDVSFGPTNTVAKNSEDFSFNQVRHKPQSQPDADKQVVNPFNKIINNIDTTEVFNKIHTNKPLEEDLVDNSTEVDKVNSHEDNENEMLKYLIATPEISNQLPTIIYEESKESDTEEQSDNTTPHRDRQKYYKKTKVLGRDETEWPSSDELIEVTIKEKNFNNSGNFAVLELSERSQREEGFRFMITPLKPKHLTFSEKRKVHEDLNGLRKTYSEFIYQPYSKQIHEMISGTEEQEIQNKRLSFSKN
jgi:hypothetical protein